MKHMKVAFSHKAQYYFGPLDGHESVDLSQTDFTDIGAIVISESDTAILDNETVKSFGIPVFLVVFDNSVDIDQFMGKVERVIDGSSTNFDLYNLTVQVTKVVNSIVNIQLVVHSMISTVKTYSVLTFVMRTLR